MSIVQIRNEIIGAIRSAPTEMPGRAEETALSNLASEFQKSQEIYAKDIVEALARIIENPPNDLVRENPTEFWRCITFLVQYPPLKERYMLIEKLRPWLIGFSHLDGEQRVYVLMGFVACGGILTEKELLEDLAPLRHDAPINWVDAAINSRLFDFAKQQMRLLFEERLISARNTILHLSIVLLTWRKQWPDDEDFKRMVRGFPAGIHDDEGRVLMEKVIRIRGW